MHPNKNKKVTNCFERCVNNVQIDAILWHKLPLGEWHHVRKKRDLQSHFQATVDSTGVEQESVEHYKKIGKWKQQPLPSEDW